VIGKASIKVTGGKLLKVILDYDGEIIKRVKFTGDFFIYPEDALERLESRLKNANINDVRKIVSEELTNARLYGVDAKAITKIVWEAFG
jgi:lipoate---protein ligase